MKFEGDRIALQQGTDNTNDVKSRKEGRRKPAVTRHPSPHLLNLVMYFIFFSMTFFPYTSPYGRLINVHIYTEVMLAGLRASGMAILCPIWLALCVFEKIT